MLSTAIFAKDSCPILVEGNFPHTVSIKSGYYADSEIIEEITDSGESIYIKNYKAAYETMYNRMVKEIESSCILNGFNLITNLKIETNPYTQNGLRGFTFQATFDFIQR